MAEHALEKHTRQVTPAGDSARWPTMLRKNRAPAAISSGFCSFYLSFYRWTSIVFGLFLAGINGRPWSGICIRRLREFGHEVYDFRNPPQGGHGFHWTDIDPNCADWSFTQYADGLTHHAAEKQFANDIEALEWADTCVLVLPCGRSAHTEAGWCKGRGMKTIVYIPKMEEPELMYKLFDAVTDSIDGIQEAILK